MIICVCHRVSDRDISKMSREGASFDELQWELGVATQCGRCEDCAREVHAQCQAKGAVALCRPLYATACAAPTLPTVSL
jgi:bacterioferritin-associated ferredoxin